MVRLALTLSNPLHIQSSISILINCQSAGTRQANRDLTARCYKQPSVQTDHVFPITAFPQYFQAEQYNLSCMFSTRVTIQYIFTELIIKINESWAWKREKEQIIICKMKKHLGIFICKLCHAIPKFPFHPNVSQISCPSQDCICLRGILNKHDSLAGEKKKHI